MQCPQCHEAMIVYDLEGIEIDTCLVCGGLWLDAGEIEDLCDVSGVPPGPLTAALRGHAPSRGGAAGRACPRCRRTMEVIDLAAGGALPLDRCPAGHGFWFDRGEMRRIVEQLRATHPETEAVGRLLGELFTAELKGAPPLE